MRTALLRVDWRAALLLYLVAAVFRLVLFGVVYGEVSTVSVAALQFDEIVHDRLAVNLWQIGEFTQWAEGPRTPESDRTPIYPILVAGVYAIFGHEPGVAIGLQILLVSLTAPFTYLLAKELGLTAWAGILAGLVVALDPVSALTSLDLLTDTLFALFVVVGSWMVVHYWRSGGWAWLISAAVVFGVSALIRPLGQFLPLLLAAGVFLVGWRVHGFWRTLGSVALFLLVSATIIASWAYRNFEASGVFTVSTVGTTNLLYYRAATVNAWSHGTSLEESAGQLRERVNREVAENGLSLAEKDALERAFALEIMRNHPLLTARQAAIGGVNLLVGPGVALSCEAFSQAHRGEGISDHNCGIGTIREQLQSMPFAAQLTVIWSWLLLGFVYIGALLGAAYLVYQRMWLPLLFLAAIIGYLVVLSAGGDAHSRMRIPVMPYLAILSGFGIWAVATWRTQRRASAP